MCGRVFSAVTMGKQVARMQKQREETNVGEEKSKGMKLAVMVGSAVMDVTVSLSAR